MPKGIVSDRRRGIRIESHIQTLALGAVLAILGWAALELLAMRDQFLLLPQRITSHDTRLNSQGQRLTSMEARVRKLEDHQLRNEP